MDRDAEVEVLRRAYAKRLTFAAEWDDPRLEAAFAEVSREDFVGRGRWQISWRAGYRLTPNADPAYLYGDSVIAILPDRLINNGQPSLHARLIASAAPTPGEHGVHVGAGTGYYSAIMAHVVGASGRVTAIEIDDGLAERAASNLRSYPNVSVIKGDGATADFDPADVIYVNAGVTRLPISGLIAFETADG